MAQLGEELAFPAVYISEKAVKNKCRVALFEANGLDEYFPIQMLKEAERNQKIKFLVKGIFEPAFSGEYMEITGSWEYSQKSRNYIFNAKLVVPDVPKDKEDALNFLMTSTQGIKKKTALSIYDWCNGNLTRIVEAPSRAAAEIKHLSERMSKLVATNISEASATAKLSKLLNTGVNAKIVRALVASYGRDAYEMITKRPYDCVNVIGFSAADEIALELGKSPIAQDRIRGALIAAMNKIKTRNQAILVRNEEHDVLTMKYLDEKRPGYVTSEMMEKAVHSLIDDKIIKPTKSYRYLYEDWRMERELAQRVCDFGKQEASKDELNEFLSAFDEWQTKNPTIHLHENQQEAVRKATNLFSVVTGGPGTGKTTVIKAIMDTYQLMFPESPITLMAPTGLAAKRMTESCGRKAETIHKILNLIPSTAPSGFDNSQSRRIPGGLIVVDEFSMVGIHLAAFLFDAIEIRSDTRIVLVGDVDQLPSVTPGAVLKDLINCNKVHVTRLTKNFRQAKGSNIADIAVKINTGNTKGIQFGQDCIFSVANTDESICNLVESEFLKSIKEYGLAQTFVITPTHKSEKDVLSSNALNKRLQALINPNSDEVRVGNWTFRVGDRVINKKNTNEVINGDIGVVKAIVAEDVGASLQIEFSDGEILIPPEKLKNLELAYAITVHSSQGCEFQSVIMPISKSHHFMLSRNLVYTAITRAKNKMHLIGTETELEASISNIREKAESDLLCRRITAKKDVAKDGSQRETAPPSC